MKPCECAPPRTTAPSHSTQAWARNADSARATPTTRFAGIRAIVKSMTSAMPCSRQVAENGRRAPTALTALLRWRIQGAVAERGLQGVSTGRGSRGFTGRGSRVSTGRGSRGFTGRGSRAFMGRGSRGFTGRGSRGFRGRGSRGFTGRGSRGLFTRAAIRTVRPAPRKRQTRAASSATTAAQSAMRLTGKPSSSCR